MGSRIDSQTIFDLVLSFFDSPMWNDTIKDFILANCYIFTGDEEYCLEHFNCHKDFCQIIENTLKIYLLDVIGISFDDFQSACIQFGNSPKSVGKKILSILMQATDFQYFAAKMYAFNVMLDREAASSFVVQGEGANAFFVTNGDITTEIKEVENREAKATAELNKVEEKLGLPPSKPIEELAMPPVLPIEKPKEEPAVSKVEPIPAPLLKVEAPKVEPVMAPVPIVEAPKPSMFPPLAPSKREPSPPSSEDESPVQSPREEMPPQKIPETPIKQAIQERKMEIIEKKRENLKEELSLSLKKHQQAGPVSEEDPMAALKRALASRVKTIISEN